MPSWEYAALLFGEPVEVFTCQAAMIVWTAWAGIVKAAEAELSKPVERTTETF